MTDQSEHTSGQGSFDALVGTTVSHYEIQSRLGQGGMGVVYEAVDTKLDRTVAVKFLPGYLTSDAEAEARFVQEAKAASALDHPNIGVIHEIDRSESGQLFIVMAYYAGASLREKIEEGPLTVAQAVDYAAQLASGLERAHDEGIIHRDIKPENVMLTERDHVRIVDFGLAKMQDVNMTRTGTSMGTLAYVSPEQARGEPVDHRTDLWALGIILYEMLAGVRPFDGPYEAAILYAVTNSDPEDIRTVNPDVSEELWHIIQMLLDKQPANRYAETREAVQDLVAVRGLFSGLGTMPPTLLASSIRSGAGTASPSGPAASTDQTPANAPGKTVSAEHSRAEDATAEHAAVAPFDLKTIFQGRNGMISLFVVAIGLWTIVWTVLPSKKATPPPVKSLSAEDRSRARESLQKAYNHMGNKDYALAQAELELALEIDSTYSAAWSTMAAAHFQLQEFDLAVREARTAVRLDSANATAYFNLGLGLEGIKDLSGAAEAYAGSIRVDPRFTLGYSALGNTLIALDRPDEALVVLEKGRTAVPGSNYLYLIYKNMGKAHLALGEPTEAIPLLERSRDLVADWPETLSLLGDSYSGANRTGESRAAWEAFLKIEMDPAKRAEASRKLDALIG